ncbi:MULTISPECIES: fimbrial protein [unclassified Tatumella]|uniref:fimbrial protein n=1 Tax=unclassified Tatumella TaxID=2649542 RepID=UPI001BAFFCA5|nr:MULTISPECIES: fimbrial protein [unclassified Tatumella]MBS0857374.1 fimbrial protein [Tatumella sp. JGM16]MBS0914127.1 fimbrial protein [Tatumella sp. JGM91]
MKRLYFIVTNIIAFFTVILLSISDAQAFTCQASGKSISGSGSVNVYVNLQPTVQANQNLVVNLGDSIKCKNDLPSYYKDPIRIGASSVYNGVLDNFTGSISYYGESYPFPTTSATSWVRHTWGSYQPWQAMLYLTATGAAGGVVIQKGTLFATLRLEKSESESSVSQTIIWNLYANNTVTVPTGGCDVSSRDVTVQLPDYPGSAAVPLSISCLNNTAQTKSLAYYLTGTTADNSNATIFTNVSSSSPAKGVGVQLSNSNGPLTTNKNVSLGKVGSSPVSLGLTASYARTSGQVVAGNVKSIVNVTFIYQ